MESSESFGGTLLRNPLAALRVAKLILQGFMLMQKAAEQQRSVKPATKRRVKSDGMRGIGWIVGHHVTTSTV
jgi:hypothetical protein